MPGNAISTDFFPGQSMSLRIDYRKRLNARRYILRPNSSGDGGYVTIPRGGGWQEARAFAKRNLPWLEDRLKKWRERAKVTGDQNSILFHGEVLPIISQPNDRVLLGETTLNISKGTGGVRERLKLALWHIAQSELPPRVMEIAVQQGLLVRRVSIRNQRSRWGSCSIKRVISLNWRLIQAPDLVRDYIIVHELMHLREMNHSPRYWKLVYEAYPQTDEAERWLKANAVLLRS